MLYKNSLSKPAQFSFVADSFMLQAILNSEVIDQAESSKFAYIFSRICFMQTIEWVLNNPDQLGLQEFIGVRIERGVREVKVIFPNEEEQDKMHQFFTVFNQKRKQALVFDRSFPPMPDIYQGASRPNINVIQKYLAQIGEAFEGNLDVVMIPAGSGGNEIPFNCI
jgi:hypothetical protein